jgi:hypothetical protein
VLNFENEVSDTDNIKQASARRWRRSLALRACARVRVAWLLCAHSADAACLRPVAPQDISIDVYGRTDETAEAKWARAAAAAACCWRAAAALLARLALRCARHQKECYFLAIPAGAAACAAAAGGAAAAAAAAARPRALALVAVASSEALAMSVSGTRSCQKYHLGRSPTRMKAASARNACAAGAASAAARSERERADAHALGVSYRAEALH